MKPHDSYGAGWADAMRWVADYMRDAEDKDAAAEILSSIADKWAEIQTAYYWADMAERATCKQPSG